MAMSPASSSSVGAVDGAEDLLHLLLEVQQLTARLAQRVDDEVDEPDDRVRRRQAAG
jgi:hypothetical protein